MMGGATLAFVSAGLAGTLALTMLFYERRTAAHWFILTGMTLLFLERLLPVRWERPLRRKSANGRIGVFGSFPRPGTWPCLV